MNRLFVLFLALLVLSGCATMQSKVADHVRPMVAAQELDSAELLDVAIVVFDSDELTDKEISELGLSEEIRRAEERYMPIQLKYTMQRTGYWGAVRVVPTPNKAHLQVRGTIVHSSPYSRIELLRSLPEHRRYRRFRSSLPNDSAKASRPTLAAA